MNYADQWKTLSSRIRGLMQAAQLHAQFLAIESSDSYGTGKLLFEQIKYINIALRSFKDDFQQSLPPAALDATENIVEKTDNLITDESSSTQGARMRALLIILYAFESEMSFILSDVQEFIRARSERAFLHLQRSIVADTDFRAKWEKAFDDGEVACEKLGAVHLLLHGIWAFKVDAQGARTDLVYQEAATDLINMHRYADGIVLTEWKKVNGRNESQKQFEKARVQAELYAKGALAGIELTGYRYAVVISRNEVKVPEDISEGEVIYRHINIAVAPKTPSQV
ncbi:MAG: hypothetical protein GY874_17900 [Desulfobacteraceae bacterium]|nr:hypothetical protein [Desulfobacteraceae bacterium]